MFQSNNHEGLTRLARLELSRNHPSSREEAYRLLTGRMGAYSGSSDAIACGIKDYFGDLQPS